MVKLECEEFTILELFLVLNDLADVISEIASIKELLPEPLLPTIKLREGEG